MPKIKTPDRAKKYHGLPEGVNKFDKVLLTVYQNGQTPKDDILIKVSSERGISFLRDGPNVISLENSMSYICTSILMWRMAFNDFESDIPKGDLEDVHEYT